MDRRSSMKRVRKGKTPGREGGFIVTWDMDSMDRASALRVYRFVFGYQMKSRSRTYRYKRFVEKEGVRYLGQSVLFVRPSLLQRTLDFLAREAIDHETTPARIG